MRRRDFLAGASAFMASVPTSAMSMPPASKELVLALDQSGSMYVGDTPHYLIQRNGHVAALRDPLIIQRLVMDQVHLRVVFWAGYQCSRELLLGGVRIVDSTDVAKVASYIETLTPNVHAADKNTRHELLLEFVRSELPRVGGKLIIDVSTDEPPEHPMATMIERRWIEAIGGTINVLAVDQTPNWDTVRKLEEQLQTDGGFTKAVRSFADYDRAIKQKILDELMA